MTQAGTAGAPSIRVGLIADQTGPLSFVGMANANVARMVVGDINAGCGACEECRLRGGHHCARRTVLGIAGRDGALAEALVLPTRGLCEVPDVVGDDAAVFAEPLAAALHVADELHDARARGGWSRGVVVLAPRGMSREGFPAAAPPSRPPP